MHGDDDAAEDAGPKRLPTNTNAMDPAASGGGFQPEPIREPEAADSNADYPDPKFESGGPKGPEPTRYGDWERKGIASDF